MQDLTWNFYLGCVGVASQCALIRVLAKQRLVAFETQVI